MKPEFYEMGDGSLIPVVNRGTSASCIKKFQETEWARKRGGICGIRVITEPRAFYFANRENKNQPDI